jgi:hypothetical protein
MVTSCGTIHVMAGEDIVVLGSGDLEERIRHELGQPLGSERQRRFRRFLLAALGSVPWVGGFIAATAAFEGERDQQKINELQQEWLDEHRDRLTELGQTLSEILRRVETLGPEVEQRLQSEEYLALVRKAFRTWDQSDTREKRQLIQNLLTNAAGTPLTADDVVRLFSVGTIAMHCRSRRQAAVMNVRTSPFAASTTSPGLLLASMILANRDSGLPP